MPETSATLARRSRRRRGFLWTRPARPIWQRDQSWWFKLARTAVLLICALAVLLPVLYIVGLSLAPASQVDNPSFVFPTRLTLAAYSDLFTAPLVVHALYNSALITGIGSALSVAIVTLMAYGLSVKGVPGRKALLFLVLASLLFPPGIIPSYLLIVHLDLLGSVFAVILFSAMNAFNLIVIRNFFLNIPPELMEAAEVDGAGHWRLFRSIVLPMSKPVIAVIGLFTAVGYYDSYFNALLFLPNASQWPIQLIINQYVIQGTGVSRSALGFTSPGQLRIPLPPAQTIDMAIVIISVLPVVLIYPFFQRYFTKGVLTGAIKG